MYFIIMVVVCEMIHNFYITGNENYYNNYVNWYVSVIITKVIVSICLLPSRFRKEPFKIDEYKNKKGFPV